MTTARTPEPTIVASRACRSGASGVVRTLGKVVVTGVPSASRPRVRACTVPTRPLGQPAAARPASTRKAVVVLPLVPVTPRTTSCSLGEPYTRAATLPSSPRGSATTQTGRPVERASSSPAGSVSTATAPRDAASAAYRAPWVRAPGSAAYRSPGTTPAEARVTPETAVPGSPVTGSPRRSPRSARRSGRVPAGRGTDPEAVGLTTVQSTGAAGRLLSQRRHRVARGRARAHGGARGPRAPGQGTRRVKSGRGEPEGTTPPAVRAYRMTSAKTGAATWPPSAELVGRSRSTATTYCGSSAGA
jgi:hypothetical protein